jgi:RNA polymerase sigma-70 factor (ECF subfamily)
MTHDQQILDNLKDPATRELAFRYLISKYKERLYWHIRKVVMNHDDANDVLQNTFIKIWNGLESFRGDSSLFTWLYRIATNESITFLNRRKRQMMTNLTDENAYLIENLESDEYFDGDEWQMLLQKAIATRKTTAGFQYEILRRNQIRRYVGNTGHIGWSSESLLPSRSEKGGRLFENTRNKCCPLEHERAKFVN